ncbi:MAG TPA: 2-oxoglutarate dehydrogenase complex dihydrolipoyllysine-residue succinyltransferase [Bdellovibrionota bacterium]|nr:2-oxoglutarate dehydrogenase complex dihydrolipoyllysine-residue succinyltransferase [Bdellovibrionota bacterium]
MKHNVVAPAVGESITEVSILKWAKANGEAVKPGDLLIEIESDKATVEVVAEFNGALSILKQAGETIPVGTVLGVIDDAVQGKVGAGATAAGAAKPVPAAAPSPSPLPASPAMATASMGASAGGGMAVAGMGPAARKMAADMGTDLSRVSGTGKDGRITKGDLLGATQPAPAARTVAVPAMPTQPGERRVPMKSIRRRIAERLLEAQSNAAILTTFNEVNMKPVMDLRNKHKDAFKAKHGVTLSFMSFFTRACVEALKQIPEVNAYIDGGDVLYHDYVNMGIAVGTDRGLVVPVLRGAENMGFVAIEKGINELATKARTGKLGIADMSGGTFTISNGGTYGSMMSTPILNPPQSAILGMHNIIERPMAVNGQVVILPMMYLALSYDHRLIDGKEAVTFLVNVRQLLESPEKLKPDFV